MNQNGVWLSILEYADTQKISISTIRRAIKAGQLEYKEENGKYFIWTPAVLLANQDTSLKKENELLKLQNKKLEEEISDLKMLLSVYETPPQHL